MMTLEIGKSYMIRTVTYFWTGWLVSQTDDELVLEDAAWIADTGRWTQAINDGELSEVEPVKCPVRINPAAVVDVCEWWHELPRAQK